MDSTTTLSESLEARHYSAEELLCMRTSLPVVNLPLNNVNKQLDLGAIFRIPEDAFRRPEYFSCPTKTLAHMAKLNRKPQQPSKRRVAESSEESEYHSVAESQQNHDPQQTQWNLRRRESSDRSSQPHSAPSGIDAQQSENFQRFYRAVVSPTHIRVTAGGRIVPNTRGLAPPAFEWNGEKFHFEPQKQAADFESSNHQQSAWIRSQQTPPGYPPVFPSGFMPPYNFLPQGNSFALPIMPPSVQASTGSTESNCLDGIQIPKFNGNLAHGSIQAGAMPQHIKLSPPTQFDQSRPFVINGQTVYPVPPGYQVPTNAVPVPIGLLGTPNFLPQAPIPTAPGFLPPGFPVPFANLPGPLMLANGQQATTLTSSSAHQTGSNPTPTQYLPVPGMVPMKEFLTSQLNALRSHQKHLENQIINNKHQIDENFMEQQLNAAQAQIKNLEAMLELHLGQVGKAKDSMHEKNGSRLSAASGDEPKISSVADGQELAPKSSRQQLAVTDNSTSKQGTKSETSQLPQNSNPVTSTTKRSESSSKSRLTMAAAMAPPFQPRLQSTIPQVQQLPLTNNMYSTRMETTQFENQAAIEARLLSKASSDWVQTAYTPSIGMGTPGIGMGPGPSNFSRSHSVHEHSSHSHYSTQGPVFQRPGNFHNQTPLVTTNVPYVSSQAVPYLVGTLPYGVQANSAKSEDFMYGRPLTEDEVQARYLYWGKAPRSVQSGLPKFDGKDFYPPSPVKGSVRLSRPNTSTSSSAHRHVTMSSVGQSFESLFTEPAVSDNKIQTPEHAASVAPISTSASKPAFEQSCCGYDTISSNTFIGLDMIATTNGSLHGLENENNGRLTSTPLRRQLDTATECDFSSLFLEHGTPGSKSSSPLRLNLKQDKVLVETGNEMPVTPANPDFPALNSVSGNKSIRHVTYSDIGTPGSAMGDSQSSSSTVEIHLSPQTKKRSPKPAHEISFAERVENFRNVEQQTLFLQNMLRNTPQTTMVGTALSGTISSATAQGYLPQYRGSAAASLAPAMLNLPGVDRDGDRSTSKDPGGGISPMVVSSYLPENLPFNRDRSQRPSPLVEGLGAEGYMRYLSQKDDNDKKISDPGLTTTTSAAGPVVSNGW